MLQLKQVIPDTWLTERGARRKAARIRKRGLPDIVGWRFITLTINHEGMTPLDAYNAGKDRMRLFVEQLRRNGLFDGRKWAWKLEIHENGFPHWHVILDYRKKLTRSLLSQVSQAWGLGRVNVMR